MPVSTTDAPSELAGAMMPQAAVWEPPEPGEPSEFHPGTVRRLQALGRMGHSTYTLGRELGISREFIRKLQARDTSRSCLVTPDLYFAVCDLYDRLWDVQGPSHQARHRAEAYGWALPLAWDDHAPEWWELQAEELAERRAGEAGETYTREPSHWIDDSAAEPWECERNDRHPDYVALVEDLAELAPWCLNYRRAADCLGISHDAMEQRIRRARLLGLDVPAMDSEGVAV